MVMHARGYEFEEAVVWTTRQLGPDIAVVAAARYAQAIAERAVERTPKVERAPMRIGREDELAPQRRPIERSVAYER